MKSYTITATTADGSRLYAAVSPAETGRRGVIAYSAKIAALVPFARDPDAIAALEQAGGKIEPEGDSQ